MRSIGTLHRAGARDDDAIQKLNNIAGAGDTAEVADGEPQKEGSGRFLTSGIKRVCFLVTIFFITAASMTAMGSKEEEGMTSKNHTASTITLSSASLRRGWSYWSEVGVDFNVGQMIT